jgi:hypothetical protein
MNCGINKVDEWNEALPIQTSVESSQYVEIPCYTSLPRDDQSSLEFRIDKSDTALDLTTMYLHVQSRINDSNGKSYADATEMPIVAPVNLFGYAMFSSVELYISDQRVGSGSHYPWMTSVLNELYQPQDVKNTTLAAAFYIPEGMTMDFLDSSNLPFINRSLRANSSKIIDTVTNVMLDMNIKSRVLPVQTEVRLNFNRSDPSFFLMCKEGSFRLEIVDAKLYALKMKLTEQALLRHNAILSGGGVSYPATRYDIRTLSTMKGAQNVDWAPFSGLMPQKIYVWQITQKGYNGNISVNPFKYTDFGLNKVQILMNERSMLTSQPIKCDHNRSLSMLMYMNTVLNTGAAPFSPMMFEMGFTIIVTDLTRDHSAGCNYVGEPENGNLRILLDYKEPLKESIVVFYMAEFNSTLHLDEHRNPRWI